MAGHRAPASSSSDFDVTDSYIAGLDVLASVGAGQDQLLNRAAEVAPEFVRLAIGFSYGEILARPGLDLRFRLLAAIAAEAAVGASAVALRQHVESALRLGWAREEIIEVLIQSAAHTGVPGALRALAECHDLLVERDPCAQTCEAARSDTGQL